MLNNTMLFNETPLKDLEGSLWSRDWACLWYMLVVGVQAWGAAAARCVDALGPSMRREVVTQFCLRVLEDYKEQKIL